MNQKLGVAILGAGSVSGEHIKAFEQNPHTEVRGILSRASERAEAKAAEHGLANCRGYTDLGELLGNEEIRIVSICTPHHLHVEQGVACVEAGRHVLVEKPIALDLPSLRRLHAAVEKARVTSVVSFVLRWNPLFETIKSILARNEIRPVHYAEVDYLHGIGDRYTGYDWIRKKQYGGTSLLTGGCHAVDAMRWFLGKDAVEVFGYANYSAGNPLGYEYEPNSVTLIRFADGTMGKVACSIECVMPYVFNIELLGERGTVRNNQLFRKDWPGQTGWASIPTVLPDSAAVSHHPFDGEIDHFVDCILNDRESHCNIADAVRTHEICIASEISHLEGRPVKLPLE